MKSAKLIFLVVCTSFLSNQANAQFKSNTGLNQQLFSSETTPSYSSFSDNDELKNRSTAILLGLGITSIPIITYAFIDSASQYGLITYITGPLWILGPSAGLFYANDYSSAGRGLMIRLGGLAAIGVGAITVFSGSPGLGALFMAFGAGVSLYSTIRDIFFKAPRAVDEYNENISGSSKVTVAPWFSKTFKSAGLSARISF